MITGSEGRIIHFYWRVVSLLDILRAYAEAYVRVTKALTLITSLINEEKNKGADIRLNVALLRRLKTVLNELLEHCEHLPMTAIAVSDLVEIISTPAMRFLTERNHRTASSFTIFDAPSKRICSTPESTRFTAT